MGVRVTVPWHADDGATGPRLLSLAALGGTVVIGVVWAFVDLGDTTAVYLAMLAALPVVAVASYAFHLRRERRTLEWAKRVGWTYVGLDPSLVDRWHRAPFGIGRSRTATEVVMGRFQGRPARSFRYRYTTGTGRNSSTLTYHVVAIDLPTFLPTLELSPDGVGATLAKALGGQDIQFESVDFNRAWRVEARDARFAHDVINPRLMERLLRPDARGLSLRIEGNAILSWRLGLPDLDTVSSRLGTMCAIADAIPRFVWQDHGYDPLAAPPDGRVGGPAGFPTPDGHVPGSPGTWTPVDPSPPGSRRRPPGRGWTPV